MQSPIRSGNPYLALLGTAWHYASGEKKQYLKVYGLFVLSNVMMALEPIIWGWFINEIQKQGPGILRTTWQYIAAYLLIKLFDWLFHGPARVMERKLAFNISRNFLQELYHKALHLPVKWHQDHHSGATINRVRKAYEALNQFFQHGFMYLHSLAKFVFSFAAMIYFSPIFGTIAVVMGLGTIMIILRFDKPYIATLREVNEREHVVSSTLFDSLSNIITVITLRLEKRMEEGLLKKVADIFPPFHRNVLINEWKWFTVDIAIGLIYSVILAGYMYQNWVPGETFMIGGLVTLMAYVNRFTGVFQNIAWQYTDIVRYNTDVQTARNIVEAYAAHHLPEAADRLPSGWQAIEIRNLNFAHNEQAQGDLPPAGLEGVNLRFARGQRIALIGESGSGKSTLLALLRGLYPPESGLEVLADGQVVNKDLEAIASLVTLFPQEPEIFENTIEYNITLGLPFEKQEVERVCETAHFREVIRQLPQGLQSNIQEKGVNLSGGQKQRLALARGVLAARDSDIVLLDEPTSSVDPKTELEIYQKMFAQFRDKAIISALHRLHLLTHFDYVYIMDRGRVVDEGSFEELRTRSPIFKELWRHQEEQWEAEEQKN